MTYMESLLRHSLAAVAYRSARVLQGAPNAFEYFQAGEDTRPAGKILAHMGDLFDWALSMAEGNMKWQESSPLLWEQEVARFFAALQSLDDYAASGKPMNASPERLLQGPIADSLTHVGQLAMMRRMAAAPVKAENYYKADIITGKLNY